MLGALFFGGGSDARALLPIGLAALFVAGAALVAALAGLIDAPRASRAGWVFVGLLGAFVVWSGLSVDWSIAPDLSWDLFNRELVYLGFVAAGLWVGALVPRPRHVVATALAAALGAVLAWSLAGKVIPALFHDGGRFARLRSPVGYWNALAFLAAVAIVLGLWLASDRGRRRWNRVAAAVFVYGAVVALVLTYSRSGIVVAVLGIAAWLLAGGAALEALATLALAVVAAAPVLVYAFAAAGVTDDAQPYSTRVHDGALFGLVLVVAAVVVAIGALLLLRVPPPPERVRRRAVAGVVGTIGVAAAVTVLVLVVRAGGPVDWIDQRWHEFSSSTDVPSQAPSRLGTLSSNHRWTWWQEAWRGFEDAPFAGQGAGTFPIVNVLERPIPITVTQPHNLLLQALSDTGVVGFLLFVGAVVAAGVALAGAVRSAREDERRATRALVIVAAMYLVQSLVDVDWDFVAVSGPVLFVVGVLCVTGARARRAWAPGWAAGVAAGVTVAGVSLLVPWLADRKTDDAYAAIGRRDNTAAVDHAQAANSLDPLSADPLFALGAARVAQGRLTAAEDAYVRAVRLQPDNPETWYELGAFELDAGAQADACAFLRQALELDRFDRGARAAARRACAASR